MAQEDEHKRIAREPHEGRTAPAPPLDQERIRHESPSEGETVAFKAVALGYHNSEIAEMSFLSVKTIETYKIRLMQKLGVNSRAELVRYTLELDISE